MENFEGKNCVEIMGQQFTVDANGFTDLSSVCRQLLLQQGQYGARYADDSDPSYPNFGVGLRITGNAGNYSSMKIHSEDVEEFVTKVLDYKKKLREKGSTW